MFPQQHFRLTHPAAWLALIAASLPATGYCVVAGRADFVIGQVEAIAADGSRHALAKGSEIHIGETINTAEGARAQVRFADGGFISLQPNSLFRVDEFSYQNKTDGTEKGFFSLLKGGLRAITGAIGHANRNTYKVNTPVATIGIRGTGYNAVLNNGLFVNVGEGAISLTNNTGALVVTAGGAAFVANMDTPPTPTGTQPQVPPASFQTVTSYLAGEQHNPAGGSTTLPSLASGSGYKLAYAYNGTLPITCDCSSTGVNLISPTSVTFNSSSQLTQYNATGSGALGSATVSFSATDGIIGWGRWDGSTSNPLNDGGIHPLTDGIFHYVVGIPTATMPVTGTATYNLMGYTTPTEVTNNSTGWGVNGTLTTNFAAPDVTFNVNVANASNSYTINGTLALTGATFSGNPATTGYYQGSTSVRGFFAGTSAARAGMTYQISDWGNSNTVLGAATFAKAP